MIPQNSPNQTAGLYATPPVFQPFLSRGYNLRRQVDQLRLSKPKTIGRLPAPLDQTGLSPEQLIQALDGLVRSLRELPYAQTPQLKLALATPFGVPLLMSVAPLGAGMAGNVYTVELAAKKYALKIFHPYFMRHPEISQNTPFMIGPDAEAWIGESLPHCKDMVDFYFARPEEGYLICELEDGTPTPEKQQGPELQKLLDEMNFEFKDDLPQNRKHGRVIDKGWIHPKLSGVKFWLWRRWIELKQASCLVSDNIRQSWFQWTHHGDLAEFTPLRQGKQQVWKNPVQARQFYELFDQVLQYNTGHHLGLMSAIPLLNS